MPFLDLNGLQLLWGHITSCLSSKVDKIDGKILSTNDYTTVEKEKLNGIETGANKTIVDVALNSNSENTVQNKAISVALDGKVPTSRTINGKALTANITLSASDVSADASGSAAAALRDAKTYADGKVADLVNSAPTTLDTLGEVAAAIQENETVVEALNSAIGNKVDKTMITSSVQENNANPVTSGAVYAELANIVSALSEI